MNTIRMKVLLEALAAMDGAQHAISWRQLDPELTGKAKSDLWSAANQLLAALGVTADVGIDADEPDHDRDPAADLQGADHPDDPRHGQAALIRAGRI